MKGFKRVIRFGCLAFGAWFVLALIHTHFFVLYSPEGS